MAYVLLLEELLPKNSFLFSIQQETFFYFYFFNLIFPANMDLQGLQLTAWGWEEVSPQAKSFWSISFVGILAASSQEDCNHCQRHNTRPKWPFKMWHPLCSQVRGHGRGLPDLFFSRQAAVLAVLWWVQLRGAWLWHGGRESHQVFKFMAANMRKWKWSWTSLSHRLPFRGWSLLNHGVLWPTGVLEGLWGCSMGRALLTSLCSHTQIKPV